MAFRGSFAITNPVAALCGSCKTQVTFTNFCCLYAICGRCLGVQLQRGPWGLEDSPRKMFASEEESL